MKRLLTALVVAAFGVALAVPAAFAQSSGNFTADLETSACSLSNLNGNLGCTSYGDSDTGNCISNLSAAISVSNGNGNALLVTPSVVTGILTNTNLSSGSTSGNGKNSSSVTAAITLHVMLKRPDGTSVAVSPDTCATYTDASDTSCATTYGVIYDERFQELSSNIFNVLTNCSASSSSSTSCNLDLILSTLSAHGFNFVATPDQLQNGTNTLNASFDLDCYASNNTGGVSQVPCSNTVFSSGNGAVNACVGPGTLTVQQVKVFSNSGSISE